MLMVPRDYQIDISEQGYEILHSHGLVYLACEERVGKTIPALLICQKMTEVNTVLIITKKKALDGWKETLSACNWLTKDYTLTNYHQAPKELARYDLVILDESHNYISSSPKPPAMMKKMMHVTKGVPLIYISATPHAQGYHMLYHQFKLSSFSPWLAYTTFYKWFKTYGISSKIVLYGREVEQYKKTKTDLVLADIQHLFVTKTRAELGFEHEPEDVLHYIKLDEITKDTYNDLIEHAVLEMSVGKVVCDTASKLRTVLHMIEGGTIKHDGGYCLLANFEKINYIMEHFGDTDDIVIMYQFKAEKLKLEEHFVHASILQSTSFAEGVDLSNYKTLIVYSQDYSTARHSQRRARQANMNRNEPIKVHFLLVKKAISSEVYKQVSINKLNYIDSVFKRSSV